MVPALASGMSISLGQPGACSGGWQSPSPQPKPRAVWQVCGGRTPIWAFYFRVAFSQYLRGTWEVRVHLLGRAPLGVSGLGVSSRLLCSSWWWWFSRSVMSESCDPMDCSPPGSSVHGILQARTLGWVASSFSRRPSRPRNRTGLSRIAGRFFTDWAGASGKSSWPSPPLGDPGGPGRTGRRMGPAALQAACFGQRVSAPPGPRLRGAGNGPGRCLLGEVQQVGARLDRGRAAAWSLTGLGSWGFYTTRSPHSRDARLGAHFILEERTFGGGRGRKREACGAARRPLPALAALQGRG